MDKDELHRRFKLLDQRLKAGKLHIAPHLAADFETSYQRVKFDVDGAPIPETVDGRLRSMLVAMAYLSERQEWKEAVALQQIQEAYFDRLWRTFGEPYDLMRKGNADPYQFAAWYSSDPGRVQQTIGVIDGFLADNLTFWDNISEPTWVHLEDSLDSKAVFAGELFPDGNQNIASSTGIYFDTVVLPDPLVKLSDVLSLMSEKERCEEVMRLALQVLQYRELALADVPIPIIAILPDKHQSDAHYRDFIHAQARNDAVRHANRLFGRPFSEFGDLEEFLGAFEDASSLVASLRDPRGLVFSTEWDGTLAEHIEKFGRGQARKIGVTTPGGAVLIQMLSRFAQAQDSLQRSRDLRGTPVIRAETSWLWFNWMLKANASAFPASTRQELHVQRALQTTVQNELSWLGDVPADALIEIRKTGAIDEIRAIIGNGLKDLVKARPDSFHRTGDRVFQNLDAAFQSHERQLKELRAKKWTFAGRDIGSFIVVGGIELTAAITGLPLFGAAAATASMSGVIPNAKDLKERVGHIRAEQDRIESTGIGILFKYRRDE